MDQVTIEPDGRWSQYAKPENTHGKKNDTSFESDDDDDDLVEIPDTGVATMHNGITATSSSSALPSFSTFSMVSATRTPPGSSREPSNSAPPKSNGKRPAVTIDLTLSDDDDEPIARAPKRQFTGAGGYSTPQSMLAYRPPI